MQAERFGGNEKEIKRDRAKQWERGKKTRAHAQPTSLSYAVADECVIERLGQVLLSSNQFLKSRTFVGCLLKTAVSLYSAD